MTPLSRFRDAHRLNFQREYPSSYPELYYNPDMPKVKTTNGLTTYVQKFLTWHGHYCNRINVAGRMIGKVTKTASGAIFDDRKMIKSSTKKGTSDLMASINGRMVCLEIKNAATHDTMSKNQDKQKIQVEKSGGIYQVITDVESFLTWYDNFMAGKSTQSSIFDTK